jgi:hypothetical protein
MPELAPTAVTLKINRTSVMLYACHYVRLPEGVGATVQTYLGSFPVTATEVPPKFAALLREATLGRPGRHQALMWRITEAVLEPARARREREAAARQRVAIGQALNWATQALRELPTMANYAKVILTPNAQAALSGLLAAAERLAADAGGAPAGPAPESPGRQADDEALPVDAQLW